MLGNVRSVHHVRVDILQGRRTDESQVHLKFVLQERCKRPIPFGPPLTHLEDLQSPLDTLGAVRGHRVEHRSARMVVNEIPCQ